MLHDFFFAKSIEAVKPGGLLMFVTSAGTMNKVNRLNRFVKKNNDFIRMFTAGVKLVEVDANGRINIPKDLENFAGLKGELVLSSAVGMIEIWDKQRYEETLDDPATDFGELAEEVMGSLNDPEDDLS